MKAAFKPTMLTKALALIIVCSFVSYYSNNGETHSLVTWVLGKSVGATILKVLLLGLAFCLACVSIFSKES